MMRRRQLLMGAGACLLLRPFLSFHRARADVLDMPGAFVLAHKCQGAYPNNDPSKFVPTVVDGTMRLSPVLSSLAGYESMTTVLAGVDLPNFAGADWHHAACAHYHGSRFVDSLENVDGATPRGETVDQHIARAWGTEVRVTDIGRHPRNTPRKSAHFVSWKQTADGVRRQEPSIGLANTFSSLIGDAVSSSGMTREEHERRARRGQSLLDRYVSDVRTLQGELPTDVAMRLEAHVDGFREMERDLFQNDPTSAVCDETGIEEAWRERPGDESGQDWLFRRAKLEAEMIAFAAACGLHRVFVYGYVDDDSSGIEPPAWEADQKPVAYRGTDAGSSMMVHPSGRPSRFSQNGCESGNRTYHFGFWHCVFDTDSHELVEDYLFRYSVGYLVRQLASRGVLENSLVLYGTSMSFDHSNEAHPYVLVGGAGGRHRGGRVLRFGPRFDSSVRASSNQVLTTVCQLVGLEQDSFGDTDFGTGPVPGFF